MTHKGLLIRDFVGLRLNFSKSINDDEELKPKVKEVVPGCCKIKKKAG
jgi:hypothetical protein